MLCPSVGRPTETIAGPDVHWPAMLSPEDIARQKADIAILDNARDNCFDAGLRQVIDDWIKNTENTMAAEAKKDS